MIYESGTEIRLKSREFLSYLLNEGNDRFYIRQIENYFDIDLTEYLNSDQIINAFNEWKFITDVDINMDSDIVTLDDGCDEIFIPAKFLYMVNKNKFA